MNSDHIVIVMLFYVLACIGGLVYAISFMGR